MGWFTLVHIEEFLKNPFFHFAMAFILAVLGKRSGVMVEHVLLITAWLLSTISAYRAIPDTQPMIPRLFFTLLFASVCGLVLYYTLWTKPTVIPKPTAPKINTLHDLFKSDCKKTHMLGTYTLTGTTETHYKNEHIIKPISYEIEYIVCGDFETKSLYFSFFLPKSDHTFIACKKLPNAYKDIIGGNIRSLMQGMIHQAPGEKAESWDELKPSGRVYVYHETKMLPDKINELTEEYKKDGLSPLFRGHDYEIMRNSPLYDG